MPGQYRSEPLLPDEGTVDWLRVLEMEMGAHIIVWGWFELAALVCLGFEAALRPGDLLFLTRRDVRFSSEAGRLDRCVFIILRHTKTSRMKGARWQHLRWAPSLASLGCGASLVLGLLMRRSSRSWDLLRSERADSLCSSGRASRLWGRMNRAPHQQGTGQNTGIQRSRLLAWVSVYEPTTLHRTRMSGPRRPDSPSRLHGLRPWF